MRASYGEEPMRRADAMVGASPEPMTMERLERKQFVVPEPVELAMGFFGPGPPTEETEPEPPVPLSGEAEATEIGNPPNPYLDPGGAGASAGAAMKQKHDELRRIMEEVKQGGS